MELWAAKLLGGVSAQLPTSPVPCLPEPDLGRQWFGAGLGFPAKDLKLKLSTSDLSHEISGQ